MDQFVNFVIFSAFIYAIYKFLTSKYDYWKNLKVPYVKPSFPFGNLKDVLLFRKSFGIRIAEIYNEVDDRFVGFFAFNQPFLIIKDPEIIKHVLIKDFYYFQNRSGYENENIDSLFSNFLFFANYKKWRTFRTKTTPLFTTGRLKNMFKVMENVAKDLNCYIRNESSLNDVLEARELCSRFAMEVLGKCTLGVEPKCLKNKNANFFSAGQRMFKYSYVNTIRLASYFVAPLLIKLVKLHGFDSHVEKIIREIGSQVDYRVKNGPLKYFDLIDILTDLKRKEIVNGIKMEGGVLNGQIGQFFFAGFETLTATMSFALYELALNPEIQRKVKDEIVTKLNENNGKIDYQVFNYDLVYLDQTIKETLRKYPLLPLLDRRATKDYHVPNSDLILEEGIPVYISLYGLHNDEKYFPNPEIFDPDRFSKENIQKIPNYVFYRLGEDRKYV